MWDEGLYSFDKPLAVLKEKCQSVLIKADDDLKVRMQFFTEKNNELTKVNRDEVGNLQTRDLNAILSKCKENDFNDTEYLKRLVVVVNKNSYNELLKKYETLMDIEDNYFKPKQNLKANSDDQLLNEEEIMKKEKEEALQNCPAVVPRSLIKINLNEKDDDKTNLIVIITIMKVHEAEYTKRLKHFFKATSRE